VHFWVWDGFGFSDSSGAVYWLLFPYFPLLFLLLLHVIRHFRLVFAFLWHFYYGGEENTLLWPYLFLCEVQYRKLLSIQNLANSTSQYAPVLRWIPKRTRASFVSTAEVSQEHSTSRYPSRRRLAFAKQIGPGAVSHPPDEQSWEAL
jgi:hypothetical protein